MQVTLSDGTAVTFKDFYSHKADKVLTEELNRDVVIVRDAEGNFVSSERPAGNVAKAYEMALFHLITTPGCTQQWLDDMSREDYELLYEAALDLYTKSTEARGRGRKSK